MADAYAAAGVDIVAGDKASEAAAKASQATYAPRAGMIGAPVVLDNGFAGLLDMGEHYLTQCCDTVGTKIVMCEGANDFSGLGYDLLAMVADDAICLGAEVVSMTNTFEVNQIDHAAIGACMKSLSQACVEQKIVIAGGEIAEVGAMHNGMSWGADAVGIVAKDRVITGQSIVAGDVVISLQETGFRCNGYSLVRKILQENFGEHYYDVDLAREAIQGSTVYHAALLELIGRHGSDRKINVKGLAHVTGGGIPNNIKRILPKGCGAQLNNLWNPPAMMQQLQQLGDVSMHDFYLTWNGGNGMFVIVSPSDAETATKLLNESGVQAQVAGQITEGKTVDMIDWQGGELSYEV